MTNQEILDNAPTECTHYRPATDYKYDNLGFELRSLADIKRIVALEQENQDLHESLTVAYMKGYSDGKAKRDNEQAINNLEQQANGIQRLVNNWYDINILDSEDIEVVSAVRFINELHQQIEKLKEQGE